MLGGIARWTLFRYGDTPIFWLTLTKFQAVRGTGLIVFVMADASSAEDVKIDCESAPEIGCADIFFWSLLWYSVQWVQSE
jgi:hypothetical protein